MSRLQNLKKELEVFREIEVINIEKNVRLLPDIIIEESNKIFLPDGSDISKLEKTDSSIEIINIIYMIINVRFN